MVKKVVTGIFIVLILVGILVVSGAFYTVSEVEQVIITQFRKPVGKPIVKAGLHFKIPFIQEVNRVEKQILGWDGDRTDMPTRDKLYISVDTFARWRITDPLEYYLRLRSEQRALSRLEDILGSATRNAVARHDLIEIVRTTIGREPTKEELTDGATETPGSLGVLPPIQKGRSKIEEIVEKEARETLSEFGIELLDVRFKRINYNPSVVGDIYERMISERQQIASRFRSEGEGEAAKIEGAKERDLNEIESEAYKEVQKIRGVADAQATEIYAKAYNQSPQAAELYEFLKTMETYQKVIGRDSTLVLSTDSALFRFLKSPTGNKGNAGGF